MAAGSVQVCRPAHIRRPPAQITRLRGRELPGSTAYARTCRLDQDRAAFPQRVAWDRVTKFYARYSSAASAARTIESRSTPKCARNAARVSLRPKPSVPSVTYFPGTHSRMRSASALT